MHSLNLALFEALAAGFSPPSALLLQLASAIALWSSWACAAVLAWVAWRRAPERGQLLTVLAAGGAASLIAHEIAASIGMPRPFMVGLSPAHVPHGLRAGLPSTHASVMFTMAFTLLWRRSLRDVGLFLLAVAVATGWARIHVGVHFPFDIAAGALLGAGIAFALCSARVLAARLAPRIPDLVERPLRRLAGGGAAPCVVLMFIAAAAWIGSHAPHALGASMLEENGPIENGTIQLYLLAVLCFLLVRVEAMSQWDRAAVCVVLLGLAAREAHWLLAHLEAPADLLRGPAALVAFAPVAVAGAWLARRAWSQRRALPAWARRRPEAMTLMTFAAVVGAALVLDQLPASPAAAQSAHLMLSFEEVLELCLPVLALLAALQARLGSTERTNEPLLP